MKKTVPLWVLISALISGAFGTGWIWNYKNSQIQETKLSLDQSVIVINLMKKLTDTHYEIFKISSDVHTRKQHLNELRSKINYYNAIEKELAKIASRKERLIKIWPWPSPPTSLSLGVAE